MKNLLVTIAIVLLSVVIACNSSNKLLITDIERDYIIIEKGGGFSGLSAQYIITEDGKVYTKLFSDTLFPSDISLNDNFVDNTFKNIESLALSKPGFNSPGNIYKKLIYYDQDDDRETIWIWSPSGEHRTLETHFNNLLKSVANEN